MSEYITKAQAIEVAESLRNIAGDAITDAFINGIIGAKGHPLHIMLDMCDFWISTKDGMPDEEHAVLICTKDEKWVLEAWLADGFWEDDQGNWFRLNEVTHWMPLPKPPKE